MKIKRLLSAVLCLAMVIGLLSAMSMTASAAICSSYYVDFNSEETVYVGDTIKLMESSYKADLATSDYGVQNTYSYSVTGSRAEIKDGYLVFKSAGTVTLYITHTQKFERTGAKDVHTDTVKFNIIARENKEGIYYTGVSYDKPRYGVKDSDDYQSYSEYCTANSNEVELLSNGTMVFLRPGNITVVAHWKGWTFNGYEAKEHSGSKAYTYEVRESTPIDETDLTIDSDAFIGGGVFPKFTVPVGSEYKVSSVSFNREMTDYTVGDRLPMYGAGTSVYLEVSVVAEQGYCFDTKKTYTVTYKGTKYEATPIKNGNLCTKLMLYMTVNFVGGQIYNPVITGLEPPVHRGTPDTKISAGKNCMVTSVTYHDAATDAEISSFNYKDDIYVRVAVQVIDDYVFVGGGEAYWTEADANSLPGVKTGEATGYFDFPYVVGAENSQIIRSVSLSVETPVAGASASSMLSCNTTGVLAYGNANWTIFSSPASTYKEGFDYHIKAGFKLDESTDYVITDDFITNGTVYINGVKAEKITEEPKNSGIYYAEADFEGAKYSISISNTEYKSIVTGRSTNQVASHPTRNIYIGYYGEEGELIDTVVSRVGSTSPRVEAFIPEGAVYSKAMLWEEGNMNPLCISSYADIPIRPLSANIILGNRISVDDGGTVDVELSTSGGRGKLNYRWQWHEPLGDWEDVTLSGENGKVFIAGADTNILTIKADVNNFSKDMYLRCIVTDDFGSKTVTDFSQIIISELPMDGGINRTTLKLAKDGVSQLKAFGKNGAGNYTYKWQYVKKEWDSSSTEWNTIPSNYSDYFEGIYTDTLTIKANAGMPEQFRIRCRVYDEDGAGIKSEECVVTLVENGYFDVNITANELSVADGETFTISAFVDGGSAPFTYQWFCNKTGSEAYSQALDYPEVFKGDVWGETLTGIADKESFPNGIYVKCRAWDDGKTVMSDPIHIVFE